MEIFYRENLFKKWANKAYCIQWDINIPSPYYKLYSYFNLDDGGLKVHFDFMGLVVFHLGWTRKCDHASQTIDVEFFGLSMTNYIYDVRHWDDDSDKFVDYSSNE
jgi:hypothetical protein